MAQAEAPTRRERVPTQAHIARALGHVQGNSREEIPASLYGPKDPSYPMRSRGGHSSNIVDGAPISMSFFLAGDNPVKEAPVAITTIRKPHPHETGRTIVERLIFFEFPEEHSEPGLSSRIKTVERRVVAEDRELPQTQEALDAYAHVKHESDVTEILLGYAWSYERQLEEESGIAAILRPNASKVQEEDLLRFEADLQGVLGRPILD